jgi:hypothetical protein
VSTSLSQALSPSPSTNIVRHRPLHSFTFERFYTLIMSYSNAAPISGSSTFQLAPFLTTSTFLPHSASHSHGHIPASQNISPTRYMQQDSTSTFLRSSLSSNPIAIASHEDLAHFKNPAYSKLVLFANTLQAQLNDARYVKRHFQLCYDANMG